MEKLEREHQHLRVVAVTIPCNLPKHVFNVEPNLMRGRIPLSSDPLPNMRTGIFGNYALHEGPFSVKFSDGTIVFS